MSRSHPIAAPPAAPPAPSLRREAERRTEEAAAATEICACCREPTSSSIPGFDWAGLSRSFDLALERSWLHYQPIVRSGDGAVFGYEALVRTSEPTLPTPGLILDAAERLRRTADLGRLVRAQAPRPFADAPASALLFINLHPEDLLDPALYEPGSELSAFASRTVLEITERAAIRNLAGLSVRLRRLRALGFRIAVDDLGAGYSGLTSFADLAPEFVKLDMSLTRDVDRDSRRRSIVRSMASLCR